MPESHSAGCPANFNALRRQNRVMDRFQNRSGRWDPLLESLAEGRPKQGTSVPTALDQKAEAGDSTVREYGITLLDNGYGRPRVPVVAGEILVSAPTPDLRDAVAPLLEDYGFAFVDRDDAQPCGEEGRSVGLFRAQHPEADLKGAIDAALASRELRERDIRVAPNTLMAMNIVTKSKSGAEPACCHPDPHESQAEDGNTDQGLVVVIDTGKFLDGHAADWLKGVTGDPDPRLGPNGYLNLSAGHGTFVAGVIRQVRPDTRIHVIHAINRDGFGPDTGVANAIDKARELIGDGHGVINLSIGDPTYRDIPPPEIEAALSRLSDRIAVVGAAGNENSGLAVFPAALERVIGVASLNRYGQPSHWSNRADWVEFSAIGEGVVSTYLEGEEQPGTGDPADPYDPEPDIWVGPTPWAVWTGTSFAAPQIAARLAEILATEKGTVDEAKATLRKQIAEEGGGEVPKFGMAMKKPGPLMIAQEPTRPEGSPTPTP